jgi:hypothetical protein
MMHVIGCVDVRERLEAYQDGELPLEEQIGIQGHLRDCVSCALEAAELAKLGDDLRTMAAGMPDRPAEQGERMPAAVIDRLRVEHELSFMSQLRTRFEDMHLVWAAAGATVATVVCLLGSMGVLQAASRERPDSLAGMITYLANPGSNKNPMRPDGRILLPRPLDQAMMPMTEQDAVFAMAAVVTREGRIQDLQMLAAEQAQALHVKPEVVLAMLEAASRARFVPAQAGGSPIAVSMVWLVEMTTVKGQNDYDLFLVTPPRWIQPRALPEAAAPKPTGPVPAIKVTPSTDSAALAG